jgi:uncharacterized membrane protein SirB2
MLAAHFEEIRTLHVSCVGLSGGLFLARGLLAINNVAVANHPALRVSSYVIDTMLLAAAILLTVILHQYPGTHAWLTTKVLLLILYIGLGTLALKRARSRMTRAMALVAALLVFGFIVGVAMTHHPAGWLLYLRQ